MAERVLSESAWDEEYPDDGDQAGCGTLLLVFGLSCVVWAVLAWWFFWR